MTDDLVPELEQRIDTLQERIRQLEDLLAPEMSFPVEWGLTGSEARVLAHLVTRGLGTKQSIMAALYSDRPDFEPEIKIVDVFICKLRKKLTPFGILIQTVWGQGYTLDEETREALKPRPVEGVE